MLNNFILVLILFQINGCATIIGNAFGTLFFSGIESAAGVLDEHEDNSETWMRVHKINGDTLLIRNFHVEEDTLYGTTQDSTELKIPKLEIKWVKKEKRKITE